MTLELHSLADRVEIAPGVHMPRLGIGTYRSPAGEQTHVEVTYALQIGYRGVDTAAVYGNEESVGGAIALSDVEREDIFLATKVWNSDQGYDSTHRAFERSLARLGVEYVDLYLIHWPQPKTVPDTWRAMEDILASGRARAIGVCNFLPHHLDELLSVASVPPAVDQVEHHPWLQQPELREYCADHGITLQAWAPVMRGKAGQVPELVEIAARHGKTPSQVSIRWILQHGVTTIPKSVHKARIAENADVFDFELSAEEMSAIDGADRGHRLGMEPDAMARFGNITRLVHPS